MSCRALCLVAQPALPFETAESVTYSRSANCLCVRLSARRCSAIYSPSNLLSSIRCAQIRFGPAGPGQYSTGAGIVINTGRNGRSTAAPVLYSRPLYPQNYRPCPRRLTRLVCYRQSRKEARRSKIEVRLDPEYAEPKLLILADSMSEEVERILRLLRSERDGSRRLLREEPLPWRRGGISRIYAQQGRVWRCDGLRRICPPPGGSHYWIRSSPQRALSAYPTPELINLRRCAAST